MIWIFNREYLVNSIRLKTTLALFCIDFISIIFRWIFLPKIMVAIWCWLTCTTSSFVPRLLNSVEWTHYTDIIQVLTTLKVSSNCLMKRESFIKHTGLSIKFNVTQHIKQKFSVLIFSYMFYPILHWQQQKEFGISPTPQVTSSINCYKVDSIVTVNDSKFYLKFNKHSTHQTTVFVRLTHIFFEIVSFIPSTENQT